MSTPIQMDIPHQLGKDGARARVDAKIGKLASHIPGGADVTHRWEGDTMHFTVAAMGQTVASRLTVFPERLHAEIDLPGMLGFLSGTIKAAVEREAPRLLK
jgi:putative polyhydroxyalkanoate system protein